MNSSDAVSEMDNEEGGPGIPNAVTSVMDTLAPSSARGVSSKNFAAVSGVVSLFRAAQSFRKGERKRGIVRAVVGLFWVGVALAQYRRKKGSSGPDASQVADTGPNVEDTVEPGGRETEHATGEEVVDTTDADIEESDTAPQESTSPEVDTDAAEDVDQRDVAETDEAESVAETEEAESVTESDEAETDEDEEEMDSESGESEVTSEGSGGTESGSKSAE